VNLDSIIQDCKHNKPKAQKLLYEKYAPFFRGICFRYVNNHEAVKDIVHDSFIKIFSNIKQYNGSGSFEGWMVRILINCTLSFLRKSKGVSFQSIENLNDALLFQKNPEKEQEDGDMQNEMELILSSGFSEADLLKVLDSIPDKYKVVFNLHCLEKYPHEEIAKTLDIDVATSRVRLMRAREMIKKELYSLSLTKLRNADEN
jgi:RNA polymerase sigma-70 factor, ECF subfamily